MEVVDLSDIQPEKAVFKRTIVKCLDAEKYGIRVADYFLSKARLNKGSPFKS